MKVFPCSDLHLEGNNYKHPLPDADVAILAGDIFCPWARDLTTAVRFFEKLAKKYGTIVFVPGNHEHYHGNFKYTNQRIAKIWEDMEVADIFWNLDEQGPLVVDGVNFVGGTLWTDYNKCDPQQMLIAQHAMSDFHVTTNGGSLFLPEHAYNAHQGTLSHIEAVMRSLDENISRTVVVTHHMPLMETIHPKYAMSPLNYSFASDLRQFIEMRCMDTVSHWFYGHTHEGNDQSFEREDAQDIRMMTNPRGYPGEHQENPYRPDLVIDLESVC